MTDTMRAVTPPLVVTKIRPPRRRRNLVRRQRLIELLSQHVDRKLILVSAPAGYGKTSLLVDYVQESAFPVCWFRVDERDADPALFLEYFVASLRQQFPGSCESTLAMLRSEGAWDIDALAASLVNEISEHIGEFLLFVLDDYQKLDDADRVNAAVDALLQYLPDNCQLIVLTRTLPKKLTLTRLAAEGHVIGIGQSHLRFSQGEIGELLRAESGTAPTPDQCQRLFEATEGWATALALAGTSLLRADVGMRSVAQPQVLFDYLAREVLAQQPAEMVDFMLATSILDSLSPALCDAVVEGSHSEARLRELLDRNAFVWEIDADGQWYRYHQLMQEFLRSELGRRRGPEVPALHRRAAAWFRAAGDVESEIGHWLAGGMTALAAERMAAVGSEFLASGRYRTIVDWVTALPEPERRARPWLGYYLAAAFGFLSQFDRALAEYDAVAASAGEKGDAILSATALIGRAYALRLMGRLEDAITACRAALDLAGGADARLAGEAHRSLGLCQLVLGDRPAAAEELRLALEAFESLGLSSEAAATHADLAAYYHGTGQLEQAVTHAEAARRHWLAVGNPAALARALNNLGTAHHAMGRLDAARECLTEALASARQSGVPLLHAAAAISLAEVEADSGRLLEAIELYERGRDMSEPSGSTWLHVYGLAMGADALRLAGRRQAAADWLVRARAAMAGLNAAYEEALTAHCEAALRLDEGDVAAAEADLQRAVNAFARLGQKRELVRSLLYLVAARLRRGDEAGAAEAAQQVRQCMVGLPWAAFAPLLRRLPAVGPLVGEGPLEPESMAAAAASAPLKASQRRRATVPDGAGRTRRLVVRALGPLEVKRDGSRVRPADWQTAATRDLFVYLLEHPHGAGREVLMALLWPESSAVRARSALHSTLHRLRRAIGREMIASEDDRYRMAHRERIRYDVAVFLTLLGRARASDDAGRTIGLLSRALRLIRGPFLEGMDADWIEARRAELTQHAVAAALQLARALERRDDLASALAAYRQVVSWEPWQEEGHRGIMRCHARAGARHLALRQYDDLARTVEAELGTTPEPATRSLYEAIRGNRPLPPA